MLLKRQKNGAWTERPVHPCVETETLAQNFSAVEGPMGSRLSRKQE